jgi:hypothetical protein
VLGAGQPRGQGKRPFVVQVRSSPIEGCDLGLIDAAREVGELDPVRGCVDGLVGDVQGAEAR